MTPADLITQIQGHPWLAVVLAVTALGAAALLWAGWRALRKVGKPADRLTVLAALIASGVAGSGMWQFFETELPGLPIALRVLFFGFIELAVLTSAVRARQNIRDGGTAGLDGAAVWALTCLSAVLSTLEASSFAIGVLRLATPFVAAWLWERGLAVERRARAGHTRETVYWRFTRERLLVRLGLAEPTDRGLSEVAAHRRITALAKAAHHAHTVTASWALRRWLAGRRLRKAMTAAIEHANLATDQARQRVLLSQIGALTHMSRLGATPAPAPWMRVLAALSEPPASQRPEVAHATAVLESWANLYNGPPALDPRPTILFNTAPRHGDPHTGNGQGHPDPADPHHGGQEGHHEAWATPTMTPPTGHGDPGQGQSDLAAVAVVADLARVAHDSERIRVAIDALGLDASPTDITAWLAERGVQVAVSNARTVLKRQKRAAATQPA